MNPASPCESIKKNPLKKISGHFYGGIRRKAVFYPRKIIRLSYRLHFPNVEFLNRRIPANGLKTHIAAVWQDGLNALGDGQTIIEKYLDDVHIQKNPQLCWR